MASIGVEISAELGMHEADVAAQGGEVHKIPV